MYVPFAPMIEVTLMAPFHEKKSACKFYNQYIPRRNLQ